MPAAAPARIVALGASNLTRGFHAVVSTARAEWGADVEIVGALGHGRSYGSESAFLGRVLPGILDSGLWARLDAMPGMPTRAIVSDVGNDILYGFSPPTILGWVEESIERLQRHTQEIVLAGLPKVGVDDISHAKFLFFRSVLFPRCRLSFAEVSDAAAAIEQGLERIAAARRLRFVRLKPEWYGVDPIHIRPRHWHHAWQEIVCGTTTPGARRAPWGEGMRLYLMRPERQRLFGVTQVTAQTGARLPGGGKVWLY
ncbi:MAG TPA: hypothetical protein VFJ02_12615 [Vicinamibacterales bacterium]|nr:hypothetical protein [Vicinamibacterales bacterium]